MIFVDLYMVLMGGSSWVGGVVAVDCGDIWGGGNDGSYERQ